jgi:arylsulfatase A-like enzyme
LIKLPGQPPHAVAERVMLIDLGPTLADLVKSPAPASFEGRSLLPALLGEKIADRPAYAELLPAPAWTHSARAVLDGRQKLLYKITENSLELYDLVDDPGEQHNLALRDAAGAAALKREIEAMMAPAAPRAAAGGG